MIMMLKVSIGNTEKKEGGDNIIESKDETDLWKLPFQQVLRENEIPV